MKEIIAIAAILSMALIITYALGGGFWASDTSNDRRLFTSAVIIFIPSILYLFLA